VSALDVDDAEDYARELLGGLDRRWRHVQCVASVAAALPLPGHERRTVTRAAWLHDVGYAPELRVTGFHPLDGARALQGQGWPEVIVSLVAYHSGAEWEARERGLADDLAELARPPDHLLDAVTFADMTSSPDGRRVPAPDRIAEILSRYPPHDPVHRAVKQSRSELLAAVNRTVVSLGLPDDGFAVGA
jgi:hypothetical protein